MPTEYFEARERALLGQRYETLYAAPVSYTHLGSDDTLFALVDGTVRFERVGKSGKKCSVKQ